MVPVIVILVIAASCVLLVVLIYRRKYRDKEKYLMAEMTQIKTKKSHGNQLSEYIYVSRSSNMIAMTWMLLIHD